MASSPHTWFCWRGSQQVSPHVFNGALQGQTQYCQQDPCMCATQPLRLGVHLMCSADISVHAKIQLRAACGSAVL